MHADEAAGLDPIPAAQDGGLEVVSHNGALMVCIGSLVPHQLLLKNVGRCLPRNLKGPYLAMNSKAQQCFQPFVVFQLPFSFEVALANMPLPRLTKVRAECTIRTYPDILAGTPPRNHQILF